MPHLSFFGAEANLRCGWAGKCGSWLLRATLRGGTWLEDGQGVAVLYCLHPGNRLVGSPSYAHYVTLLAFIGYKSIIISHFFGGYDPIILVGKHSKGSSFQSIQFSHRESTARNAYKCGTGSSPNAIRGDIRATLGFHQCEGVVAHGSFG